MKVVATNRRVKYDYQIESTLIAGVVLAGAEVKSAKLSHLSLKGSYVDFNRGELYLLGARITPYKYAAGQTMEPDQPRKLLVHKKELEALKAERQNGKALVPTRALIEHGFIKIEIAVARGRKKIDKRQLLKAREALKTIRRTKNR